MSEPTPSKQRPAKSRRPLRWLRDLSLLLLAVLAIQWWQSRDLPQGLAPPLVGHLLDGTPYQLEPERAVLVHFWASWCPICRLEQDSIDAIADGAPVITIATVSGSADEVEGYLLEHGLKMPVLMDEDGDIAHAWGVSGVPATFVVDRDGRIAYAGVGYSTGIGLRLRLWMADL